MAQPRDPRAAAAAGTMRAWLDQEIAEAKASALEAYRLDRFDAGDAGLRRMQRLCRARWRLLKGAER